MTVKLDGTNGVLQNYDYQTPTTGFSYTFAAGTQTLVMQAATALATGTVTMPAYPADGMVISISSVNPIAALTVNANTGQSIVGGGVNTLGANKSLQYIYRLSNTTWYPYASVLDTAQQSDTNGVLTTGTVTSGTASLTVGSATGINLGDAIVGQGITPGTYVTSISGTTVTMSANAGATLSAAPVQFYGTTVVLTPSAVAGQLCKAWVNFNGVTTVTIRASYNVSSITRNGAGDYTINFTNPMQDAKFAIAGCASQTAAGPADRAFNGFAVSASQARVFNSAYIDNNTSPTDAVFMSASFFR